MDERIVANIKMLGIDMISGAGSGHPGIVLGAAPILYTLYRYHLCINPNDPEWLNRDRFVMSAGHGSALLYATLFMSGYDLSIDDLKKFRQLGSNTPGHPEYGVTKGVDCSTGPLGQGLGNAVGMAIASKKLNTKFKEQGKSIFDYKVYALCGDGDLMEGISHEVASLAGTLKLNNLIILYDSNNICLDGATDKTFKENVLTRFSAYGWDTEEVKNGNDIKTINKAITKAKTNDKPTIIKINTIIGNGSLSEGTNDVHGKVLKTEDIEQLRKKLNIPNEPFFVDNNCKEVMINSINARVDNKYQQWKKLKELLIKTNCEFKKFIGKENDFNILNHDFQFEANSNDSTRIINSKVINVIANNEPNFLSGSADLFSSTMTYLNEKQDLSKDNYNGKNIWFGVREFGMGAILNGLSLSNFRVCGSTFLVFSDYLKPAIRMSALMNLPVTYIFTHDSINIGQDGPTHQPIEQLAMLRSIPNVDVYRPADANELVGCWSSIMKNNNPSVLILSRASSPMLTKTDESLVNMGAYIVRKETEKLYATIIATGTEVAVAIKIADDIFKEYKADIRVVSMPCIELYLNQSKEYRDNVLPKGYRNIVIEAGSSFGWHQFVYNQSYLITLDQFGCSAKSEDVLKKMSFDYDSIKEKIVNLLK